jgi:hypothetical protein
MKGKRNLLHRMARPGLGLALGLGLWTAAGGVAEAQINTEAMRPTVSKDGVHGVLTGGVSWKTGNSNSFSMAWMGKIAYHRGVHTPFLQLSFNYAMATSAIYENKGFAHLRWPAMWHRRVGSELFTQVEFNEFTSQIIRTLVGAGVRVAAVLHKRFELYVGTGYMFEYEELSDVAENDPHPDVTKYHRWTSYVSFRVLVSKWLVIANTVYIQPRFRDFGDYRFLEDLSLIFKIYKMLHLQQLLTVAYDSRSPLHIFAWDTSTITKLVVKF